MFAESFSHQCNQHSNHKINTLTIGNKFSTKILTGRSSYFIFNEFVAVEPRV